MVSLNVALAGSKLRQRGYTPSYKTLLLICALYGAGISPTKSEPASSPDIQKMNFDVYTGGVNVVKADMTVNTSYKDYYGLIFGAETRGFLGSLVPWKGTFESKGWVISDENLVPELHESIATWKQEKEVKSYHYTKEGGFQDLLTTYNTKKPKHTYQSKELTDNTTDVMTATLIMMKHVAMGGECNGSWDIFDGKRRYAMSFQHQRFVKMEATQYNIYSGPAIECTVEVIPEAGEWHKKPRGWLSIQEQGRARGMMPTVWFAIIGNEKVAVPVRVRVKTAYGTLFMHLTRYEAGDKVLTAKGQEQ